MNGLWLVMDGRARYDSDAAAVYEAIEGVREQVPLKAARKLWRNHDAVLCFAPALGKGTVGTAEYVRDVD